MLVSFNVTYYSHLSSPHHSYIMMYTGYWRFKTRSIFIRPSLGAGFSLFDRLLNIYEGVKSMQVVASCGNKYSGASPFALSDKLHRRWLLHNLPHC